MLGPCLCRHLVVGGFWVWFHPCKQVYAVWLALWNWPYSPTDPCNSKSCGTRKRSTVKDPEDSNSKEERGEILSLRLLDEAEALELMEFDPMVTPKNM